MTFPYCLDRGNVSLCASINDNNNNCFPGIPRRELPPKGSNHRHGAFLFGLLGGGGLRGVAGRRSGH